MNLNRLTVVEAHSLLGIGRRQLDNLVKANTLPRHGRGRKPFFIWSEMRDAYLAYRISLVKPAKGERGDGKDGQEPTTIEQADLRQKNADAELKELKAAQMRGELIEVIEVERQIGRIYGNLNTRLRAIPSKITHELFGESNRVKFKLTLEKEIEQTQRELVEIAATTPDGVEDDNGANG
jgi:phage terminase Nu1 subunit (DNA packaging protein)